MIIIYVDGTTIIIPQEWIYEPPFADEEAAQYALRNEGLT